MGVSIVTRWIAITWSDVWWIPLNGLQMDQTDLACYNYIVLRGETCPNWCQLGGNRSLIRLMLLITDAVIGVVPSEDLGLQVVCYEFIIQSLRWPTRFWLVLVWGNVWNGVNENELCAQDSNGDPGGRHYFHENFKLDIEYFMMPCISSSNPKTECL